MTYKQIQSEYERLYKSPVIQNCWIADVKRELGLTKHIAYNRKDKHSVVKPCPKGIIRERIMKIIKSSM
jgi:ribosomal protein S15P/S13E